MWHECQSNIWSSITKVEMWNINIPKLENFGWARMGTYLNKTWLTVKTNC